MDANQTHEAVRERYGAIARESRSCCGPACCAPGATAETPDATQLGYSREEQAAAPEGSNLGLGCGNPQAIAALQPGEDVLDLGSGAGFDCFLAARAVGLEGSVIGVDMTSDMLARARQNATKVDARNVEFRLGEIEHLPVADESVDIVMSNCVVNLSPDKPAVYREAFRVLRAGGRIAIADVLARAPLSDADRKDLELVVGCIGGAATVDEVTAMLDAAGFIEITIGETNGSQAVTNSWAPGHPAAATVFSATVEARKP